MITSRKLKLAIVSDNKNEAYSFIRNQTYQQYRALNMAYNHLFYEFIASQKIKESNEEYQQHFQKYKDIASKKHDEYININNQLKEESEKEKIEKLEKRVEKAKTAYDKAQENVIKVESKYNKEANKTYQDAVGLVKLTRLDKLIKRNFNLHYDVIDKITQTVNSDFSNDMKKGILTGERNFRNYKKTNPLMVRYRSMTLYEEKGHYYIRWIKDDKTNKNIIFKIIISAGSKQKQNIKELKSVLSSLVNGNYEMRDSSISLDKHLILNLTIDMPVAKDNNFIPNRVVGVDLGLKIPAYVSVNDTHYIRQPIGSYDDFLKIRTQTQAQRRRLQIALQSTKGGKGRDKKLHALERLKEKEKNFAKTYSHFVSKSIVDFAVKNHAGVIHLEKLEFDRQKHKSLIRNWSFYQVQTMIEYKAEREGIAVYYVDSAFTSQTCSRCGNLEKGQRENQEKFICKKCGFEGNADYNASQNIAKKEPLNKEKNEEKELEMSK